jgi:hypothetical protein
VTPNNKLKKLAKDEHILTRPGYIGTLSRKALLPLLILISLVWDYNSKFILNLRITTHFIHYKVLILLSGIFEYSSSDKVIH